MSALDGEAMAREFRSMALLADSGDIAIPKSLTDAQAEDFRHREEDATTTDPRGPSKKQQLQQQQLQHEKLLKEEEAKKVKQEEEVIEEVEEEVEEEEVEEEVEEEEEEDVEEEEEEDNGGKEDLNNGGNKQVVSSSAPASVPDDDDEEPIDKLLEPFSKDQLVNLLREAAEIHLDVADRIRRIADEDPVHRKIFVHGLGWDTTAETLVSAFKQYGDIEDCKAVTDKLSGKSKGYGFILFKRRSGARKALREPQKKIGSRMTACQLASIGPVTTPPQAAAPVTPQSEYTQRKIYVSNVGSDLDPQKLTSFFAKFGEIEEGPLGLDKNTGKPKGFCLFVYKSPEGAKKALEEPHKNFDGHILHCQKAIDGPKPGKAPQQRQQHHHAHAHAHAQTSHYPRNDNTPYAAAVPSHLMAATSGAGMGFNHGAGVPQSINPALGQALTALLTSQGAGLGGLTNVLGSLGTGAVNQAGVPPPGIQSAYSNQSTISPGVMGYGTQAMQGNYGNPQIGQGGSGRGQHGQYGGLGPYMGH
ncbi:UBP1-associated protein 2A [Linum grandiflorum]